MKKAIVILYVIAITQFVFTLAGFAISYAITKEGFVVAGKGLMELCDKRYVQK